MAAPRKALPKECAAASSETPSTSAGSLPSEFPEGVYRVQRSAQYLIGKGIDPQKAYDLAGTVTLTFENRRWREHGEGDAGRISLHTTALSAESPHERSS